MSFFFLFFRCIFFLNLFLLGLDVALDFPTNSLLLMTVTVPLLCKALIAVLAQEGSEAAMHAYVVHHVAELREGVSTSGAHQELVRATRVLVLLEQFHVTSLGLV